MPGGTYNLGEAKGTISFDYRPGGAQRASQDIDKIKGKSAASRESLSALGAGAAVAGGAVAAGLGLAVKSAAGFEERLSGIQAVSGATSGEMEQIRAKALQLGADTKYSASESAVAMEELIKAGIPVKSVLAGAADATVSLAAAGGVSMPEAASLASNAMKQFSLNAQDMPKVADLIAGAANASAIDVGEFGQSLQQVGAVANLAGLSFDDTAVAIAEMGNAGIKGSDAGTSLKTMLSNLNPQTVQAQRVMEELGITTYDSTTAMQKLRDLGIKPIGPSYHESRQAISKYLALTKGIPDNTAQMGKAVDKFMQENGLMTNQFYDQHGKLKSLKDIQGVLGKSLEGLSAKEKQAALQTIFGSDAIRAAAVLAKSGAQGYDEMASSMKKVSAADVAATRMNNLRGKIEQLKGSVETISIQVGSILIPALANVVSGFTSLVNKLSTANPAVLKFGVFMATLAVGLLAAAAVIAKVVSIFFTLKQAFVAIRGAMAAVNFVGLLTNPIGLAIVAILAIAAALVLLWNHSQTFRNIVTAAWTQVKVVMMIVLSWIRGVLLPGIVSAWNTLVGAVHFLASAYRAAFSSVRAFWASVWGSIRGVAVSAWNAVSSTIRSGIAVVRAVISAGLGVVRATWRVTWALFGPVVRATWNLVVAATRFALAWLRVGISGALRFVLGLWRSVWSSVRAVTAAVWRQIQAHVAGPLRAVVSIVSSGVRAVLSRVIGAWSSVRSHTSAAWHAVRNAVAGPLSSILSTVRGVASRVVGALSGAWRSAQSVTSGAWRGIVGAVASGVRSVSGAVGRIRGAIMGAFAGAGGWLTGAGHRLIAGLASGIRAAIGTVTSAINSVASAIRAHMPGSPIETGDLKAHGWNSGRPGRYLVELLADGVTENIGLIRSAMGELSRVTATTYSVPAVAAGAGTVYAGRVRPGNAPAAARMPESFQIAKGAVSFDESGQAYFSGIAQAVYDSNSSYTDTLYEMG